MHQFDDPGVMTEEGVFASDKWLRLNEILTEMGIGLELRWIPYKNRVNAETSKPYAICQRNVVIMFAGELDDPVDILARLWEGNNKNGDVLKKLEARERAEDAFRMRKHMEEMAEAADEFHFMATNRSNWFIKRKRPDGKIVKIDTTNGREVS